MSESRAWTEKEIDKLKENYSSVSWQHLAKILPARSRHEMRRKAHILGLRKTRVGRGYYSLNENFFKEWSSKVAYVTGVIAADGEIHITKSSKKKLYKKYYLRITSKDFSWLDEIRKRMGAGHPIYKRVYPTRSGGLCSVYQLQVGSKKLVTDLLKMGITSRKSFSFRFPKIPAEYLNHFVRGYFDGDGNPYAYMKRNRYPCIQLSFYGTKDFLMSLNHKIAENVNCAVKNIAQKENIYELRYNTREAENVLCWMYRDATLYLPRKYQIFVRYISKRYARDELA